MVLAADHVVRDQPGLVDLCKKAAAAAREGYIVTLGVKPDSPATGYGYLRAGAPLTPGGDVLKLEAFVEKPDRATAQSYVDAGYYWNSGNFIFRADVMQAEIAKFEPEIFAAAAKAAIDGGDDGSRLSRARRGRLRTSATEVDRLRGHGENPAGGADPGRHRLVGRRQLARGVGIVGPRRAWQFGARQWRRDGRAQTCMCARTRR